jgi:hypothetical protein
MDSTYGWYWAVNARRCARAELAQPSSEHLTFEGARLDFSSRALPISD